MNYYDFFIEYFDIIKKKKYLMLMVIFVGCKIVNKNYD